MSFRKDFTWGAATAAYQIEGAADRRGLSIWDQFSRWPGKTFSGESGDLACNHYEKLEEDLDLMSAIGIKAYRFSISWPRIIPGGTGRIDDAGLDFYDRLVDGLVARDIVPWITLYHWDLPVELYYRGGWLNSESPEWFAEYAAVLARKLGNRVSHWITFNEPDMFVTLGHVMGIHAPGLKLSPADTTRIIHHVHRAHGRALAVLRDIVGDGLQAGMAPALGVVEPGEDDPVLVEAAREGQFSIVKGEYFSFSNSLWNDPTFFRRYPDEFIARYGQHLPAGWEKDLENQPEPANLLGANIYQSYGKMIFGDDGKPAYQPSEHYGPGFPRSNFMWPVTPGALYWGPKFLSERYGVPIAITENGMSSHDWVHSDGRVSDPARQDYATRYLKELRRGIADGADVRAYFHWSLMDNFEWAEGYRHRFGLVHIDFQSGRRTMKESAKWYRRVIESNGAEL
jgi:beta-glucosidase